LLHAVLAAALVMHKTQKLYWSLWERLQPRTPA